MGHGRTPTSEHLDQRDAWPKCAEAATLLRQDSETAPRLGMAKTRRRRPRIGRWRGCRPISHRHEMLVASAHDQKSS
jgi:hypothetical protein